MINFQIILQIAFLIICLSMLFTDVANITKLWVVNAAIWCITTMIKTIQ